MMEMAHEEAAGAESDFTTVVVLHMLDEASMRLRSLLDSLDALVRRPSRGRSSKVLQHMVTLYASGRFVSLPMELEALADKTAATQTTAMEAVLRKIVAGVICGAAGLNGGAAGLNGGAAGLNGGVAGTRCGSAGAKGGSARTVWLIHVFVGDGIATNALAARGLLAALVVRPLNRNVVYFLMVLKCAAHQANLALGSVVRGHAAACSDHHAAGKKMGDSFCGNCVRLYKYLLAENYEEFVKTTLSWLERVLEDRPPKESKCELLFHVLFAPY